MFHTAFSIFCAVALSGVGCASSPPSADYVDPVARENAIFECKKDFQAKKKARFERLPPLVRRLMGENRILIESTAPPKLADLRRAMSRFPLQGDSDGLWKSAESAQNKTASGSVRHVDGVETVSLIFGQPGRSFILPISLLERTKTGLQGAASNADLQIRPIDEHHVLVNARAGDVARTYALIRTYASQSFAEESKIILPDYPVYSPDLNDDSCEDILR